ncbi:MAG: nitrilase-related carbon-nitrogen hydrolase [Candidatus Eisenbacteria bacterium]
MKIAIYQSKPRYGEIEYNVFAALNAMGSQGADLYVLPELFSTGYLFGSRREALALAEPIPSGRTTQALIEFCRSEGCAIAAGVAEVAGNGKRVFNAAVLLSPRGLLLKYRKTHLFNDEKLWLDPGDTGFSVATCKGARIGLMICFDWIFPEAARILALKGADVICHPSNLVLPYCQAAMTTRSIENRVFTVTANRVGTETRGRAELTFSGGSQVTDTVGRVLIRGPGLGEKLLVVTIDPKAARNKKVTPRNHVISDRRPRLYGALSK